MAGSSGVSLVALLAAAISGCGPGSAGAAPTDIGGGTAGSPGGEPRIVRLTTTDAMRFEPDSVVVRLGETVRIVVHNAGAVIHDLTVGDLEAQERHEQQMRLFFDGSGSLEMRDHGIAVLVEPGETAELIVTFDQPGEVLLGCHVPGHWDARMRGVVIVE
ncbi:MAG TPA: plastocyanin/azurin family copper-binding protein [Candidatus Sulfomarinibacteraceae bacterium]|nr:plastocyanin/azurin family copper-binding protein [Candidatus Sulfomarinibacteraceae bacterium]